MIKIYKRGAVADCEIFARNVSGANVSDTVASVIAEVRARSDAALYDFTEKFDGVRLDCLEVTDKEFDEALAETETEFLRILEEAASNIRAFHEKQKRCGYMMTGESGEILGERVMAIEKVGLYVPGGTAAYPSTVLMDSIPAKIAGCDEIVMVTPPGKNGKVNSAILAAALIAGVTRVFKVGGAQAIAALAYGTESIPKVDKIVGPGNAYVAEAKRQVFGTVSIDMIAGPSEILIVADAKSSARNVAADLLSQAEHDRLASAVLVTDSEKLANEVAGELEKQIPLLPRCDIARASIDSNGKIIVADTLDDAIDIANRLAPEHLELCVEEPFTMLGKVKNAGSVFMGRYCPEVLGDYYAGTNHTLPTSGTARFSSPLSVDDFIKKMQYIYYPQNAFAKVAKDIDYFARKEGLDAHGKSALTRIGEDGK